MKKLLSVILILTVLGAAGCSNNDSMFKTRDRSDFYAHEQEPRESATSESVPFRSPGATATPTPSPTPAPRRAEFCPSADRMRNICEMATVQYYFQAVEEGVKTPGTGMIHWGETDRRFWYKYRGSALIGIDLSRLLIEVDEENEIISITIPRAEILGDIRVDSNVDNMDYVMEPAYWYRNDSEITASDLSVALGDSAQSVRDTIESNTILMNYARERAVSLIETYISQLNTLAGSDYVIEWNLIE